MPVEHTKKETKPPRKSSFDQHFMEDVFKDQFFEGPAFGDDKQKDAPDWDQDPWAGGDAFFTHKQT